MNHDLLTIYLNDHLAGSVVAIEQLEHCLARNPEGALGAFLPRLLREIEADQGVLKDVLTRVGGAENPAKKAGAWVAEKLQRVKPSGDPAGYSDLNRLEELEGIAIGIAGKLALWRSLEAVGPTDDRLRDVDFGALARRAQRQRDEVEPHRLDAARRAFAPSPTGARADEG